MSDPKVVRRKRASRASEAQVQANRANSLKSTGPTSPEGKAKSSQNAMSHGFFSRKVVLEGTFHRSARELRKMREAESDGTKPNPGELEVEEVSQDDRGEEVVSGCAGFRCAVTSG